VEKKEFFKGYIVIFEKEVELCEEWTEPALFKATI
jgi:hypothetical protein